MREAYARSYGKPIAIALLAFVVCTIAILWSWNTIAVDLFSMPEMNFKHAVAAELLIFSVDFLLRLALSPSRRNRALEGETCL